MIEKLEKKKFYEQLKKLNKAHIEFQRLCAEFIKNIPTKKFV